MDWIRGLEIAGQDNAAMRKVIELPSGNLMCTGSINGTSNRNLTLNKLNPSGALLWSKKISLNGCRGTNLVELGDGNIVINAILSSSSFDRDLVIKCDTNGTIFWSKLLEDSRPVRYSSLIKNPMRNHLLHCSSTTINGNEDVLITEIAESNGSIVQSFTYGSQNSEIGQSLIISSDSNFIFAGRTDSLTPGNFNTWITKANFCLDNLCDARPVTTMGTNMNLSFVNSNVSVHIPPISVSSFPLVTSAPSLIDSIVCENIPNDTMECFAYFTGENNGCVGYDIDFTNFSSDSSDYQWSINGTAISTEEHYSHYFDSAGTNTVTLNITKDTCQHSHSTTVTIYDYPKISTPDTTISAGDSILIGTIQQVPYIWKTDNGNIICECEEITLYPWENMYVTASSGICSDSVLLTIRDVSSEWQIPNIVTSNGDGMNDLFYIKGLPSNSQCVIYNRWGRNIYTSENYANNWNPVNIPPGIYYYLLKVPFSGTFIDYKGWFHVVH